MVVGLNGAAWATVGSTASEAGPWHGLARSGLHWHLIARTGLRGTALRVVVKQGSVPSLQDIESAFVAVWSAFPGAPELEAAPAPNFDSSFLCAQVPIVRVGGVGAHVHVGTDLALALCAAVRRSAASSDLALDEALLVDVVGELANQLAGSLKVFFGSSMSLSVPRVRHATFADSAVIGLAVAWDSPSGSVTAGLDLGGCSPAESP